MLRSEKQTIIDRLSTQLAGSSAIFLLDYTGIDVGAVTRLRSQIRKAGGSFTVSKNTFFIKASDKAALQDLLSEYKGQTALVTVPEDPVSVAKVLHEFIKGGGKLVPRKIWLDRKLMPAGELEVISKLPTKGELLSQFVGLVEAPLANFVGLLESLMAEFPRAVDALAEKQGGEA